MPLSPDQEMQLAREIDRAGKAKAILDSPLVKEIIAAIEADTLEKWKASPIRDYDGQHELRLKWQVIQEFRGQLVDAVETGKLASQSLQHERSLIERAKNVAVRVRGFIRR